MKKRLSHSLCLLLAVALSASCDPACLSEQRRTFPHAEWHKDTLATLTLPVDDTVRHCALVINLRTNDDYPYNNLILAIATTSPLGLTVRDTVEYRLTDDNGHWAGTTGIRWMDSRLAFREEVRFLRTGDYTFAIAHLMRNETLPGVGAISMRIEQTPPNNGN
jgi:gliding motility-associated lipoprotein GldH